MGSSALNSMRFPSPQLVEQIEQKPLRIRYCLRDKKRVNAIVGLYFYIKAPTHHALCTF